MIPVAISDFDIQHRSKVFLDKDDFAPFSKLWVSITVKSNAQQDSRDPTEEEMRDSFYESAKPLLSEMHNQIGQPLPEIR